MDNKFLLTYQFRSISGHLTQSFEWFRTEEEMNDFILIESQNESFKNIEKIEIIYAKNID